MNEELYKRNVIARASNKFHGELVFLPQLRADLYGFKDFATRLDRAKKALFYGKSERTTPVLPVEMGCAGLPEHIDVDLFHALLGALTEAGEIAEALLKALPKNYGLAPGEPIDAVNVQEELGDLNWYRTLALSILGQTDAENRAQNDAKLERRFGPVTEPDQFVFSEFNANNRDLEAERSILEGTGVSNVADSDGTDGA